MRITTQVFACALDLFASEAIFAVNAVGQTFTPGEAFTEQMKAFSDPLGAPKPDPGELFARSIECAQKADARGLQGKTRKHFLHECKSGI
jgi:hypothetical protein